MAVDIMETDRECEPRDYILSEKEALTVDFVSEPEAKRLLSHYALGDANCSFNPDFNLDGVLQICGGVPTVLIIAGYELRRRGNTASECNNMLKRINYLKCGEQEEDLRQVMVKAVYSELRESSQEAFVNIVFFFYGWDRSKVAETVGEKELRDLEGKALVTTSEDGKVMMHDIVREEGRKLRPLPLTATHLCIVLRDQHIAMGEKLIYDSDPERLIYDLPKMSRGPINSGLLDIDEGLNIFSDHTRRRRVLKLLYVINSKESSLRVVVIYEFCGSAEMTLVTATAVFNYCSCHVCRICMDNDWKLGNYKRSRYDINEVISAAYIGEAFLFIQKALKITDFGMLAFSLQNNLRAARRSVLRPSLQGKILVTTRHLSQTDILGHHDGIQASSRMVDLNMIWCILIGCGGDLVLNAEYNLYLHNTSSRLLQIFDGIPCIFKIGWCELKRRGNTESACEEIIKEIQDLKELEGGGDIPERMVDIVYRRLGESSQDAFMDIVFYFSGWDRWEIAGIVGMMELLELVRAGLVSKEGRVMMDEIVRARGRKLSEGNRIADWESWSLVLKDRQKLQKIKAIWLREDGDYHIHTNDLQLMQSLRVLYLGQCIKVNGKCRTNFEQLRFLCISYEDILPKGPKLLTLLRKTVRLVCLVVCLTELRIESNEEITINLPESLQLRCFDVDVPESFPLLDASDSLPLLHIKGRFTSLGERLGKFSCLKILRLEYCSELRTLPLSFGELSSLTELDMSHCSMLDGLPDSFGELSSLTELDMSHCSMLGGLPDSFGELSSLTELDTSHCSMLESLPNSFGNLSSLQILRMSKCSKLGRLPDSFGNLSSLTELDTNHCSMLESLPDSFGNLSSLTELDLSHCSMLERLPSSFGDLSSLRKLVMSGCDKLERLPEDIGNLTSLRHLDISDCTIWTWPESFGNIVARRTCALFLPTNMLEF